MAESKQAAQNFYVDRFNLRKLHELKIRKKYHNEITNMFCTLAELK